MERLDHSIRFRMGPFVDLSSWAAEFLIYVAPVAFRFVWLGGGPGEEVPDHGADG